MFAKLRTQVRASGGDSPLGSNSRLHRLQPSKTQPWNPQRLRKLVELSLEPT